MSKIKIKGSVLQGGSNRQVELTWPLDALTDYVWEINLSTTPIGFLQPNVVAFCRLLRREDYEADSEYEADFYEFPAVPDETYLRAAFLRRLLKDKLITEEEAAQDAQE